MLTVANGSGKWLIIAIVSLSSLVEGQITTWNATALPFFIHGQAGFTLTEFEQAMVLNVYFITKFFSVFFWSYMMDRIGRKLSLELATAIAFFSWLILQFGTSCVHLAIGRACQGMFASVQMSLIPTINGEMTEPKIRGAIGIFCTFSALLGHLLQSLIALSVPYKWTNVISIVPSLFLVISSALMLDSPYYYLMKGSVDSASRSLEWLRGSSCPADLERMGSVIKCQSLRTKGNTFDLFKFTSGTRRAFAMYIPLVFFVCGTGLDTMFSFLSVTLPKSSPFDAVQIVSIVTGIQVVCAGITCFFIDRVGRRPLTITAFMGSTVCLGSMVLWYALYEFTNVDVLSLGWLPFAIFLVHGIFYSMALEPVPYIYLSELFSPSVKGIASTITAILKCILPVCLNQAFYPIKNSGGLTFNFLIYALSALIGVSFSTLFLIETKGQSLEDIQDMLTSMDSSKGKS